MKIALLAHSVNPRGGVVHVLELGAALQARGHAVTLLAPSTARQGFFRPTPCRVSLAPVAADATDLAGTVRLRIDAMRRHLRRLLAHETFDVFHTHEGIGANALADLVAAGEVEGYVRTVHHLDRFADARVQHWQERSVRAADRLFGVSALTCEQVRRELGLHAEQVPNGVDLARFTPRHAPDEAALATRQGLVSHPRVLCVGGVEARKNTRRLLQAFVLLRRRWPKAQLVVAGGASLLDHSNELAAFRMEAEAAQLPIGPRQAIVLTGPLADADMPRLYRAANVLAMPSLLEGFGLAALEALACGVPAVVSRRPPFTEHFAEGEVHWADPLEPASIAAALIAAIEAGPLPQVPAVCARHSWAASAARHEALYRVPAVA
jgi:glycosyltransferase-like protein